MEKSKDRLDVLEKIKNNERLGLFDQNVEADAPGRELMPNEIDYKRKKLSSKIKTKFAYLAAKKFLVKILKDQVLMVDEIRGYESIEELKSGAVFIANHFNPLDSFIMHLAYMAGEQKKRKLYRVINEANYTSFPGFYGMLMRNFYTLPLSSNRDTMKLFLRAVDELLTEGNFILVYAEQAMWWNYKKPRPLKKTAFKFAASNNVPTIPIFVTMKDSDKFGPDGFPLQKHIIHIGEPIYPNKDLSVNENAENMMKETFRYNKKVYEETYKIKLKYDVEDINVLPKYVIDILNEN